ncbi:restriction endonuclease [Pseudomonas oryzihabitans]|uniref:restriction endonuclease n=1 Tax=Pseudomonas oryzihabitans TaxID=47885 RepID=UPI00119F04C9|nr:restriction endonuclease [Pseudomonas oryzihabitans]
MIYQCINCRTTTFQTTCPQCNAHSSALQPETLSTQLIPLDPSFYPDFKYQSKGIIKDFFGKKKEQAQLSDLLRNVLRKYAQFRKPYFINFIYTNKNTSSDDIEPDTIGARIDGSYSERELFREVLVRKGFNELEELPLLLEKLLLTTIFNSEYDGFSRELSRHIQPSLRQTLRSWIEEAGTSFRKNLPLFIYFLWENDIVFPELRYETEADRDNGAPLLSNAHLRSFLKHCEETHYDILVNRLAVRLEHFDPNSFITMYLVDAMSGFEFEDFLVKIFQTIGYDVEETKRTGDQGADLFASRFGKKIVIQSKNYSGTVGNSAVQQALSAKAFYGCDEAMVITNSYFTKPAIELANSASVRLVDRTELQTYLDDYNQKIIEQFSDEEQI